MRSESVRLGVESLERRDNPSVFSDFWDVATTDPIGGIVGVATGVATGVAQGGANLVNGVQDIATGSQNITPMSYNNTIGNLGGGQLDYLHSPDWSRDLVVENDPLHGTSKFLGGNGAVMLATLGASSLASGAGAAGTTGAAAGEAGAAGATTTAVAVGGSAAEVTTVSGVATVEIGFFQNASREFMRAVVNAARQQGANTLVVETGPVVNADLAIKLG